MSVQVNFRSLTSNTSRILSGLGQALAIVSLVLVLFYLGTYDWVVFDALTARWNQFFDSIGLADEVAAMQRSVSRQITWRSLPTMLTYGVLYTGACLLLLRFLLPRGGRRMRWALLLYGTVFVVCGILLLVGKLAGDVPWVYRLARRLIDFIVSPLPVIVLVPLLRWYVLPEREEGL